LYKILGWNEPINISEGCASATILILKSILDALVGFSAIDSEISRNNINNNKRRRLPMRQRIPNALLNTLLKPAAGFFAALSQFACGIRNVLTANGTKSVIPAGIFPIRMPRPMESKVLTYSASRAAGWFLEKYIYLFFLVDYSLIVEIHIFLQTNE